MRSGLISIWLIAALVGFSMACGDTAQPPGITKLAYGKNANAEPTSDSFEVDEPIYVIAEVAKATGKFNLNFVVTTAGTVNQRDGGQPVMNKSVDFEGVQPLFLHFSIAYPGQYKIEAILSDANHKQIDTRSGLITVTGEPAPLEKEHEKDNDADRDKDKAGAHSKDRESEREKERDRK